MNEDVNIIVHDIQLDGHNSLDIFKQYDVIIDASDNLVTRYIINDTCVKAGKPLVSGSAIHCDGQLTVYNYKGSVCFRCLHPTPQSPETVGNCASAGVLGPGIIVYHSYPCINKTFALIIIYSSWCYWCSSSNGNYQNYC